MEAIEVTLELFNFNSRNRNEPNENYIGDRVFDVDVRYI